MTVQAGIDGELSFLRAEAEARMKSAAIVRRAGTEAVQDETTGLQAIPWTVVYTGPFRLGASSGITNAAGTRRLTIGGLEQQVGTKVAHFPIAATNIADGDLIEVVSGDSAGLVLRIVESDPQDQATARRVPVLATDRPTEW